MADLNYPAIVGQAAAQAAGGVAAQMYMQLAASNIGEIPPQTTGQLISVAVVGAVQQPITSAIRLANDFKNEADGYKDILKQLKDGKITLKDVVISDDGCRIMPQRPSGSQNGHQEASPTDTVVEELHQATEAKKETAKAGK